MSRGKMNWDRVRGEAREQSHGVEQATHRRRFKQWVTESNTVLDKDVVPDLSVLSPMARRAMIDELLAALDDFPKRKPPLEDDSDPAA